MRRVRGVPRLQEAVEWQACMTPGRMSSSTYTRIGSSFNKQVVRPTGRCVFDGRKERGLLRHE